VTVVTTVEKEQNAANSPRKPRVYRGGRPRVAFDLPAALHMRDDLHWRVARIARVMGLDRGTVKTRFAEYDKVNEQRKWQEAQAAKERAAQAERQRAAQAKNQADEQARQARQRQAAWHEQMRAQEAARREQAAKEPKDAPKTDYVPDWKFVPSDTPIPVPPPPPTNNYDDLVQYWKVRARTAFKMPKRFFLVNGHENVKFGTGSEQLLVGIDEWYKEYRELAEFQQAKKFWVDRSQKAFAWGARNGVFNILSSIVFKAESRSDE
jgi:hypothetical protein